MQQVLQTALTPLINMLAVAGLVSIPGMMTGQIISGGDAITAAKYQILVMFGVGAAGTSSSILAIAAAMAAVTDSEHRLRLDRLSSRPEHPLAAAWCASACV